MKNVGFLKSNGVDLDSALELLGDMEMYNETLQDFITEVESRIENIKKYKEESDMGNYAILVHALKSDSKYLGFSTLAELSLNHELESKAGNTEYVNNNFESLVAEAERIINLAKEYLEG